MNRVPFGVRKTPGTGSDINCHNLTDCSVALGDIIPSAEQFLDWLKVPVSKQSLAKANRTLYLWQNGGDE